MPPMPTMRPLLATLTCIRALSRRVRLIASIHVHPLLLLGPVLRAEREEGAGTPAGEGIQKRLERIEWRGVGPGPGKRCCALIRAVYSRARAMIALVAVAVVVVASRVRGGGSLAEPPNEPSTLPGAPGAPEALGATDPTEVDLTEVDLTEVDLTEVDLEEVLRPHVSPRTRTAQVGAVLVAVLVILGLLLHSIEPFQQQGTAALLPSPSPSLIPMPPTVVIASSVNFGTLTVNGQVLKDPPPVVTRLVHRGMNVVTLSAPPFGQHICRFWYTVYPVSSSYQLSSDTPCSGSSSVHDTFEVRGIRVVPDLMLDIELSDTDLPSNLATRAFGAALQAVAAVQPQTVVPAGQYYATGQDAQGHISSPRAATRLHAQMRFALEGCGPSLFCPIPLNPRVAFGPSQRIWSVGLFLTARWRFTPPVGPAVLSPAVPLVVPLQLFLADDGASGWTVVTPPPSPATTVQGPYIHRLADQLSASLCQSGMALAGELMQATEPNSYGLKVPYDRGVEGCEFQVHDSSGTAVRGTFLWRFGVLLAVDTGAHALAPWLPLAPQAEIVAVEV